MNGLQAIDQRFVDSVWEYYDSSARDLPWRSLSEDLRHRMYQVVVSELMLQQTQVARVVDAYTAWMQTFPTMHDAAASELITILQSWSGLGYYRRAKFLHDALKVLDQRDEADLGVDLESLKGIGVNTAGAIRAYVFDEPVVYVETNIRTAVIHHYFSESVDSVHDSQILEILHRCIASQQSSRQWYWALMDYGSMIKKLVNNNARSATYKKQSTFVGSQRQLRAKLLKLIISRPKPMSELLDITQDDRTPLVLESLLAEKLIELNDETYTVFTPRGVHL